MASSDQRGSTRGALEERGRSQGPWGPLLRRLARSKTAVAGAFVVAAFVSVSLLSTVYTPYDPIAQDVRNNLRPPSLAHPLGTDELGRDILSRIMVGASISLLIGLGGVGIALLAGVSLGASAG